jgi:hypothetical protein
VAGAHRLTLVHLVVEVGVQLLAVLCERDDAPRKRLDVDEVDGADVLAHGRLGRVNHLRGARVRQCARGGVVVVVGARGWLGGGGWLQHRP